MDDYGQPLDASASPGLSPLPAQGGGDESLGLAMPAPVTDRSTMATDAAPIAAAPQQQPTSGLGLADYKSARGNDDAEYLKSLPTAQKIGLLLQSYQAGVEGRPNPFQQVLEQKRKREVEFRAEIGTTIQTIKSGVELVKSMPPGKERDALIEQVVRSAGVNGPVIKNALMAAGTDNEKALTDIVSVIENPHARELLITTASKAADPRKEALKLISDSDFMKRLEQRADQTTLPVVTTKMSVISRAMEKAGKKNAAGDVSFSMADLQGQNKKLPKEFQLSDAELGTINRNQAAMIPYGLKTDKTAQAEQEAIDKRGPQSDMGKLADDLKNGRITKTEYDKAVAAKDNKVIIQNQQIEKGKVAATATDVVLTKDAIDDAAARYGIDGTLPPNLGRGAQGSANHAKIINRAAEIARENGDTGEEARLRQIANKANTGALAQLTKQEQAIGAFEKNATKNADIALANSAKVDRTGAPVVNRWLLAGMKEIAGDKDVATFHQANDTFISEYAKIMSGSMGNTAVSDSLRREAQSLLSTAQTPDQYKAVIVQMKQEMGNRMKSFAEQKTELANSMRGTKAEKPAAASAAPASGVPQVGEVRQGYRFKGGDPSKQSSWEKVQ